MRLAETEAKDNEKPTAVLTYAAPKAEVERGTRKYFPRAWVKDASQTEIERVAEDLVAEADEVRVIAYLSVFRNQDFPGDPTRLFPLLGSANKRVAYAAAGALARISDPAIRSFGLHLIAEGQPDLGTRLLRSSYGEGDSVLLRALLDGLVPDADAYHGVGLSVLRLIEIESADKPPDEARAILAASLRERAVFPLPWVRRQAARRHQRNPRLDFERGPLRRRTEHCGALRPMNCWTVFLIRSCLPCYPVRSMA
jgi:hypothetical protein